MGLVAADADERATFVAARRAEYGADVDIPRLAAHLPVHAVVEPSPPRPKLAARFSVPVGTPRGRTPQHHGATPV